MPDRWNVKCNASGRTLAPFRRHGTLGTQNQSDRHQERQNEQHATNEEVEIDRRTVSLAELSRGKRVSGAPRTPNDCGPGGPRIDQWSSKRSRMIRSFWSQRSLLNARAVRARVVPSSGRSRMARRFGVAGRTPPMGGRATHRGRTGEVSGRIDRPSVRWTGAVCRLRTPRTPSRRNWSCRSAPSSSPYSSGRRCWSVPHAKLVSAAASSPSSRPPNSSARRQVPSATPTCNTPSSTSTN